MELALVEFQYHESRGSYYQHRQPSPPNPLVAGVVELALVANFLGGLFSGGLFSGGLFSGWPMFQWPMFWWLKFPPPKSSLGFSRMSCI